MTQSNKPEEADLFGVRALERGYFGGIAQSHPGTPSPSSSRGSIFRIPYGKPPQTTATTVSDPGTGKAALGNRKDSDPDAIEEIDPRPSQLLAALPPTVASDLSIHPENPPSTVGSPGLEVFAPIATQIQAPTPARRNPFVPSGTQSPRAVPLPREPIQIQHSENNHSLAKEQNPPPNQLPRPQLSPKLSMNTTRDRTDSGSCRVH